MSEEISGKMHKLEITTADVAHLDALNLIDSSNLPLTLNPFYDEETDAGELKLEDGQSTTSNTKQLQRSHQGCRRCRLRRRSESVADAYKSATMALSTEPSDNTCWTHSTLGIQRQSLKHRRNVLRPPVLRKLQNLQKLLQTIPIENIDSSKTAVGKTVISSIDNAVPTNPRRGICDFRDLIHECQNLLELENDVKGRFGLVSPDQQFSKTFTTMQPTLAKRSLFSNKERKSFGHSSLQPCSPERNTGTSPRSTASTSCSQQAGNSVAAVPNSNGSGDDVTIDELASYFDTFVHIPKKMSTMAEMMYI